MAFGNLALRPYRGFVSKVLALGLLVVGAAGQEDNDNIPTVVDDRCDNTEWAGRVRHEWHSIECTILYIASAVLLALCVARLTT